MTRAGSGITRSDFDDCFLLEPPDVDAATVVDLVRKDVRRRRRRVTAAGFATVVSLTLLSLGSRLIPAESGPINAVPATPPAVSPSETRDGAAPLEWRPGVGYLDVHGHGASSDKASFASTAGRIDAVVMSRLGPTHPGLRQDRDGGFSYGTGDHGVEEVTIDESFAAGATTRAGAWTFVVSLTRLPPGRGATESAINQLWSECVAYSDEARRCGSLRTSSARVWVTPLAGHAFVVGLVQADGEVASLAMVPTNGSFRSPKSGAPAPALTPSAAIELLSDHDLDVIG